MPLRQFADRTEAGIELGRSVSRLRLREPVIVLALPRGGVPVAYEVAQALHAPLDVLVVRKIGMPGQPELAIGAIASGNIVVREPGAASSFGPDAWTFALLVERERAELERRERRYRGDRPPLELTGKTVVLVDDGLATGATMLAAIRAARKAGASSVVVAAPVASDEGSALVGAEADAVSLLKVPAGLQSVGEWYRDFAQVDDSEVRSLLEKAWERSETASA
jgi:putative phosphoribosyl transferase